MQNYTLSTPEIMLNYVFVTKNKKLERKQFFL